MSAEQMTSLVLRKARTARDAQAARAMSLGRALRLTAAKQADQMMKLAVSTLGVTRRSVTGEDLGQFLDPDGLLLLMDGPGTQVAAMVLEPVLVAGLIQQQTMGKVTAPPAAGTVRRYTSTDASLCAPFMEALLARAALLPEAAQDRALLHGYRFGVWAQEPRKAQMALEGSDYEVVEVTLDLAAGLRVGKIVMILPHPVAAEVPDEEEAVPAPPRGETLARTVMGLQAELMVALTRIKLPLQRVSTLKPGDLLDLNLTTMSQALVMDASGRAISRGTLGQIDGMRAVQVEQKADARYTEPRRRAADRAELDLPDVTAAPSPPARDQRRQGDVTASPAAAGAGVPKMSDLDIFGNLDDLPELPDMDMASAAADAQMAPWSGTDTAAETAQKRLAGR